MFTANDVHKLILLVKLAAHEGHKFLIITLIVFNYYACERDKNRYVSGIKRKIPYINPVKLY